LNASDYHFSIGCASHYVSAKHLRVDGAARLIFGCDAEKERYSPRQAAAEKYKTVQI